MITNKDIKKIRKGLRLTQAAFAEILGVDCSAITHWESGRTYPRRKSLEGIEKLQAKLAKAKVDA
jgi:DNA-binding transcriptional regulator YiaG